MGQTEDTGYVEDQGDSVGGASRFGGEHTEVSEELTTAESWDRDAEDVDALLSPSDVAGVRDDSTDGEAH